MTQTFIPLVLFSSILLVMLVFMLIFFMAIHRQRQKQHQLELQQISRDNQNNLLLMKIEVQEDVLQAISSEIHDNIGQVWASSQMTLLAWEEYWIKDEKLGPPLKEVACRLQKSASDLRNLSHVLHRGFVERIGLIKAIEKELEYVRSTHQLTCVFHHEEWIPPFNAFQNMLLFRAVQETIMNVVRHAHANKLTLKLNEGNANFRMVISDDGIGMSQECFAKGGIGLQSIQERVNLLSGTLRMTSVPGNGTTFTFTFKLTGNEQKSNSGRRSRRPMMTDGLISMINSLPDFQFVMEAENGKILIDLIRKAKLPPEICIVDINMPVLSGCETCRIIKSEFPSIALLALSMYDYNFNSDKMLRCGANGFLHKTANRQELNTALRAVYSGAYYFSGRVSPEPPLQPEPAFSIEISDREMEFLTHCCSDMGYKEIADQMNISLNTAHSFRERLFGKLEIASRAGLILFAMKTGLVSWE